MHAEAPRDGDDLNDVERRLSGWRPAAGGLHADAMLFAAGQAAGRRGRGRLLWPALCVVLAVQVAALGAWGLSERAECQALANRLEERGPAPSVPPAPQFAKSDEPSYTPSPDDYFHLLRRVEQDPGRWLVEADAPEPQPLAPRSTAPPILRAGQRGVVDQ
jgi:hypothetical protein